MATTITEVPLGQSLARGAPIRWTLNVTSDDLSAGKIIKEAEPEKRHWIESLTITYLSGGTEWIRFLNGANPLIGPIVTASGVPWSKNFHQTICTDVNVDLIVKTKSAVGVHILIEGYTDAYPNFAYNPVPSNGATGVSTSQVLSWSVAPYVDSNDVYFNDTYVGNQVETTYEPELVSGTGYTWRIDVVVDGSVITGNTWTFTT